MPDIKNDVGIRIVRFTSTGEVSLPGVVRRERNVDRQTFYCQDADTAARALINSGIAFHDLEVLPVSLEEAVMLALEEDT